MSAFPGRQRSQMFISDKFSQQQLSSTIICPIDTVGAGCIWVVGKEKELSWKEARSLT